MYLNASPWREQCDAARLIRTKFGSEKALGHLLGEKFLNYLRAAVVHAAEDVILLEPAKRLLLAP